MIALLQRVASASVHVAGHERGRIDAGLLAFVCAERGDTPAQAARLAARVLAWRMFGDAQGRMNRSLLEVGGGLLAVSQFTLAADTQSGNRPSFTPAAPPDEGRARYEEFVAQAQAGLGRPVATGEFGADMQVALVNDGPVTFWLRVAPAAGTA